MFSSSLCLLDSMATVLFCSLGFVYYVVGVAFDVSANCVVMDVAGVYS